MKNITSLFIGFLILCFGFVESYAQNDTSVVAEDTLVVVDTIQVTDRISVIDTFEVASSDKSLLDEVGSHRPVLSVPQVTDIISVSKIFTTFLVLLLLWMVTKFLAAVLTNLSERFYKYRLIIKRILPITKVSLWSFGLYFIIAGILQPPLETVITVSASIGIAVGFASQDILRNIFGGIMIILDRPFQVGDKIEVDKQYGEVLEIGLRSVRIVTEDDSVVTIPNGEIMNKAVANANSSAFDCQVVAELFLPARIDINTVSEICRKAAITSRYVYLNKPVFVHTTHGTMGPREFLKVRIKAYVLDIRFEQELRSDMTNLAMSELKRQDLLD
jgi:small-conductance mechanosensitive channel